MVNQFYPAPLETTKYILEDSLAQDEQFQTIELRVYSSWVHMYGIYKEPFLTVVMLNSTIRPIVLGHSQTLSEIWNGDQKKGS